jgi:ankyrin repeat protein
MKQSYVNLLNKHIIANDNIKIEELYKKWLTMETKFISLYNAKRDSQLLKTSDIILINVYHNINLFMSLKNTINNNTIFIENFRIFTKNLFMSVNWNNLLVVGESVVIPLLYNTSYTKSYDNNDICLYIYGITNDNDFINKIREIYNTISKYYIKNFKCIIENDYIHMLLEKPYGNIKIYLNKYLSKTEIIINQNINLNSIAYNGKDILCSVRFLLVMMNNKINLINYENIEYEAKLQNYIDLGFLVNFNSICINYKETLIDPRIYNTDKYKLNLIQRLFLYTKKKTNKLNINPNVTLYNYISDINDINDKDISKYINNSPYICKTNKISDNILLICDNKIKLCDNIINGTLNDIIEDDYCIYSIPYSHLALLHNNINIYEKILNKIDIDKEYLYYTKNIDIITYLYKNNIIKKYDKLLKTSVIFENTDVVKYLLNIPQLKIDYMLLIKLCTKFNKLEICKLFTKKCTTHVLISCLIFSIQKQKLDFFNLLLTHIIDINYIIKEHYNKKDYCSILNVLLYELNKNPENAILKQMFIKINNYDLKYVYTEDDINNYDIKINYNKSINLNIIDQPLYLIYKSCNYWLFCELIKNKKYLFDIPLQGFKHYTNKNIIDLVKISVKKYSDLLKYFNSLNNLTSFKQYELYSKYKKNAEKDSIKINYKFTHYKHIHNLFDNYQQQYNTTIASNMENNFDMNKYINNYSINFYTINDNNIINQHNFDIYMQLYDSIYNKNVLEFKNIIKIMFQYKLSICVYSNITKSNPLLLSIINYNEYITLTIAELAKMSNYSLITEELIEYIIKNNKSNILELFYKNKDLFDYNIITKYIDKYLEYVIINCNVDMAILLLKYGCKFAKNLLYLCIGYPEMLVFLIKYAKNLSNQEKYLFDINIVDDNGNNIIQQFLSLNKEHKYVNNTYLIIDCIKILYNINNKIIFTHNKFGENVLHSCIKYLNNINDYELIFQLFLELKVPLNNTQNSFGIIHYIAQYGSVKMMQIILRLYNDIVNDITIPLLYTPLLIATKYNNLDVVSFLIKHGANINLCDIYGNYAHHYALINKNYPLFNILQNIEANYICNNYGYIPYDYFLENIDDILCDLDKNNYSNNDIINLINSFSNTRIYIYNKKQIKIINYMYNLNE